jgi:hypothetical protein
MVNIARFWTQHQNRTTVSAKRNVTEMRHYNKTWIFTRTLDFHTAGLIASF